jgi:hypothetical protein
VHFFSFDYIGVPKCMVQKNVNFSREELILSRNGQYQTDAVNV